MPKQTFFKNIYRCFIYFVDNLLFSALTINLNLLIKYNENN